MSKHEQGVEVVVAPTPHWLILYGGELVGQDDFPANVRIVGHSSLNAYSTSPTQ